LLLVKDDSMIGASSASGRVTRRRIARSGQQGGKLAKQLQGTWSLVSVETLAPDGTKKVGNFGPNPKGQFIFDSGGRYSIQIFRPNIPKIAANARDRGTAEENKAVVEGTLAHFGTCKVNDKEGTLTVHPQASSYPNWTGVEQPARKIVIKGEELTLTNPAPTVSAGGGSALLIVKRAK
jgi:hypothetical protein